MFNNSCYLTKCVFRLVRLVQTLISLSIIQVVGGPSVKKTSKPNLWSICSNAQTDLRFHRVYVWSYIFSWPGSFRAASLQKGPERMFQFWPQMRMLSYLSAHCTGEQRRFRRDSPDLSLFAGTLSANSMHHDLFYCMLLIRLSDAHLVRYLDNHSLFGERVGWGRGCWFHADNKTNGLPKYIKHEFTTHGNKTYRKKNVFYLCEIVCHWQHA